MPGPFAELLECLFQQGSRAGDEQADVGAVMLSEVGLPEQAYVERRHAHEHRRPRQQSAGLRRVEPRAEDHRGAVEQRRVARHEQTVGVEDREHVQEHVALAEPPGLVQHLCVRVEVRVGEHRALRLAGGARRVEQRGEVAGAAFDGVEGIRHRAARLDQGAVVAHSEGERLVDAVPFAERRESFRRLGSSHHESRLGIAEEVVQLPIRIRGVEREIDRARAQAREVEDECPRGLLHLHRDAVARRHAPFGHHVRTAGRRRLDVGPGPQHPVRGFEAGCGAVSGEMRFEECVEVGVRHRRLTLDIKPSRSPSPPPPAPRST